MCVRKRWLWLLTFLGTGVVGPGCFHEGAEGGPGRLGPYSNEPLVEVSCAGSLPATAFVVWEDDPDIIWAAAGPEATDNQLHFLTLDGGTSWQGFGGLHAVAQIADDLAVGWGTPLDKSFESGPLTISFDSDEDPTFTAVEGLGDQSAGVTAMAGDGRGRAFGIDGLERAFVVEDNGTSWSYLEPLGVQRLLVSGDHVLFWKGAHGFLSTDGGATFAPVAMAFSGSANSMPQRVAISPSGMIAVAHEGFVWLSTDEALTWRELYPMSSGKPLIQDFDIFPAFSGERLWLSVDFLSSSRYDGINGGLLVYTDDNGATFVRRHPRSGGLVGTGVMVQEETQVLRIAPRFLHGLPDGEVMMSLRGVDTRESRGRMLCRTGAGSDYGMPDYLPASVPTGQMVAYDRYGTAMETSAVDFAVDLNGKAHFYDGGQLFSGPRATSPAWWVPTLGEPHFQPPEEVILPVGFDILPTGNLVVGASPAVVYANDGPSPGIAVMDPTDQSFVEFIELGELQHHLGATTDRMYVPMVGFHVRSDGSIWADIIGGPAPFAYSDSYPVPFPENAASSAPGGLASPFTYDTFFQRYEAGTTIVVRVASGDPPDSVECELDTPTSTRCFRYPGSLTIATIDSQNRFFVVDNPGRDVWMHDLNDDEDSWSRVATGFVAPSRLFADRSGGDAIYVLDGDVYAFRPVVGKVFKRRD
jgi:hypothetical protein